MATELKASIRIDGALRVGPNPNPPNAFTLHLEYHGDPVTQPVGRPMYLHLKGIIGQKPGALLLNGQDAQWTIAKPVKWNVDFNADESEGAFTIQIYTFEKTLFRDGDTVDVSFSNVISRTDPSDNAILTLEGGIWPATLLKIPKIADRPGIVYFISDPVAGYANLPGDSITLKWHAHGLVNLELTRVGSGRGLPCDFSKEDGRRDVIAADSDTLYRLSGYYGNVPVSQDLAVTVLHPGWHELQHSIWEGDPGYPPSDREDTGGGVGPRIILEPTLLFNADDACLYAIFRHSFHNEERALLFRSENPFAAWTLVPSSVSGQDGTIPKECHTSPGVYYDGRLWLVGGSQIENIFSNAVWCFSKGWWTQVQPAGAALPSKRMGHAVLAFQGKLWVIGGRDTDGNALNDVWTLQVKDDGGEWTKVGDAPWKPRSLLGATVYDDKIWIYGGAEEPSSATLFNELWAYDPAEARWRQQGIGVISVNEKRKPIASSLQSFRDNLHLFGKFRTEESDGSRLDEAVGFYLSDRFTRTWERFPTEGLKTWGTSSTFSYQSLNYRDRVLIARALGSEIDEGATLKVYIP